MKILPILGYLYLIIASLFGTYEIIYLRFIYCTKDSILGFFWCPETSNVVIISVKALLWPLFYFL